ncbi:MAG: hypothetical protein ACFFAB_15980 [Candidatus Heimdallarchaeota archaeon]
MFEHNLTVLLNFWIIIIIISGFYTFYRILFKNRWINYLLNIKRIRKNIEKYKKSNDYEKYAISLIDMGTLYGVLKKYSKELEYYLKAYHILEDINHNKLISVICQPIASIYEKQKNYSNTETFLLRGLEFSKVLNEYTLIREYLTLLGEFYEKRGDLNKAADCFAKASLIR